MQPSPRYSMGMDGRRFGTQRGGRVMTRGIMRNMVAVATGAVAAYAMGGVWAALAGGIAGFIGGCGRDN